MEALDLTSHVKATRNKYPTLKSEWIATLSPKLRLGKCMDERGRLKYNATLKIMETERSEVMIFSPQ